MVYCLVRQEQPRMPVFLTFSGECNLVVEKRRARRFLMALPLAMASPEEPVKQPVQTRDVSSGGVYFEMAEAPEPGSRLDFVLSLPTEITHSSPVKVRCIGKVVRVDRSSEQRVGVAATIERYEFLRSGAVGEKADIPVV